MSHRLAVAAVIAHHGGFDDAGAFLVGAGLQREYRVARVPVRRVQKAPPCRGGCPHTADRLTHELPQFLLGHSCTSTLSMMPMTAASTGAAFRPRASPAARPSMTTSTFSVTPAPTESTASSGVPRGASSRPSGCTSSSFAPSSFRCFWVDTTVPITRAICIRWWALRLYIPMIDDADD